MPPTSSSPAPEGRAAVPTPEPLPEHLRRAAATRALVMGVVNVTPDSFSDGGRFSSTDDAIAEGLRMHYAGADIVDVGGESTRPNADSITVAEEQKRIVPVVAALVKAGALVSVDTMHADTAAKAIDEGAAIVNDVSGLDFDPAMPELIAERGVHYVLMHQRGNPQTMDSLADYDDVVEDVITEITAIRDKFYAAGVSPDQIIVDPGIGFAKKDDHNWALLRSLERFQTLGHRILIGASRKRFLGTLLTTAGKAAAPGERGNASLAVSALAAAQGVWCVRVHDVASNLDAVKVAAAWTR